MISAQGPQLQNKNIDSIENDNLYHLGLTQADAHEFKDIKYVAMGGSADRMEKFAYSIAERIGVAKDDIKPVGVHSRYVVFVVGPVLVCSHGMGNPSISIILVEIAKLLSYAKADAIWMRMGTCGGIGLEPGTVVVSEESLNGALEPSYEIYVLGKKVSRPAIFDKELSQEMIEVAKSINLKSAVGKTMCCDDFYEGQGRLDGMICNYDENQKLKFLQRAHEAGVRNIEMESLYFGAFCNHIKVRSVVCAVTLLNRLEGD